MHAKFILLQVHSRSQPVSVNTWCWCYCTHLVPVKGAVKCVWSTPTGFLLHGVRAVH